MNYKRSSSGFTLIEILVAVAIIGILAALAIPQFNTYRQKSFDSRSLSDLKNAATGEEAYYAVNDTYVDCIGTAACLATLPNFNASPNTNISMFYMPAAGATPEYFTGLAYHPNGTRNSIGSAWMWNSNQGGLQ